MEKAAIIILACDFAPDGSLGFETRVRIGEGIRLISKLDHDHKQIFLGAGKIPFLPSVTEKESIKKYIDSEFKRKGEKVEVFTSLQNAWGTFDEIKSIFDSFNILDRDLYIVSSGYHIKRIKWIIKFFSVPRQYLHFVSIGYDGRELGEKMLQPLKYIKVILWGLIFLIKRFKETKKLS